MYAILLTYPIAATQTHPKDVCYSAVNAMALMCGIVLLCYLTLKVVNSEALEQVWTSNSLEGTACSVTQQT
ncbi:hypothetical protein SADUNF_Sadunf15G0072700 [Salix dunnii]|uniref:Uncharacterized protein n=1 Tax=Salix dunnii TaxID=1413687 RepID=A0A835JG61_9ROSI|nr:hypothetical protein SADUNF_Sadunf15G0072700 [Salix dunnii]